MHNNVLTLCAGRVPHLDGVPYVKQWPFIAQLRIGLCIFNEVDHIVIKCVLCI